MYVTLYDVVKHCLLAVQLKVFLNDTHVKRPYLMCILLVIFFALQTRKFLRDPWRKIGNLLEEHNQTGKKGALQSKLESNRLLDVF